METIAIYLGYIIIILTLLCIIGILAYWCFMHWTRLGKVMLMRTKISDEKRVKIVKMIK